MKRTLISAFASVISSKVIKLLILAVSTPILVRILGPRLYGEYAAVMAVFALLMILVSSGISSGGQKYLAEERADTAWKAQVFNYYLRIATVLALFASVLLLAVTEFGVVESVFQPHYAVYFYLLAILAFAAQFREYARRCLMGLKLEHYSEPITVLYKLIFAVFAISLAYLGYGVVGVLSGHIIASLTAFAIGALIIARHIDLRAAMKPLPEDFPRSELRSFNNLSILYFFLLTSLYHVDVLMLELFTTSETVGYYKAALVMAQFLWFVPKSVQAILIQSTADLWANDRIEEINSISSKVTRYTALISLLLAIGLAALAQDVVPLYYGADFAPAVVPLLLLLPGTIGFAVARPLLAITHAKGAMGIMIGATGVSAGLNLVLNLILIPPFGMAGAAIATSIGYGSLPIVHIIAARRVGYAPLADVRPIRITTTAVLSAVGIFGLAHLIDNIFIAIILVPPIGLILFTVLSFVTGAIGAREVLRIVNGLPFPTGRTSALLESRLN